MMRRNNTKVDGYPFVWLDEIVENTLNPEKNKFSGLDVQTLDDIRSRLDSEADQIWLNIKKDTFCLFAPKKVKAIVIQYDLSLRYLKEQATINLAASPDDRPVAITTELVLIHVETLSRRLEKRFSSYLKDAAQRVTQQPVTNEFPLFKILCPLSVDQMGIIIKAADQSKLIISRSISLLFRSIAPYLSTEKTKDISWNSMRSSTYHMEKEDIEVVLVFLEKLTKKVREYL